MKRLLAIVTLLAALAAPAAAGEPAEGPVVSMLRRPSSYGVWATYRYRGTVTRRYTYPGYTTGYPPPAFLYYGYPQSGAYSTGF